MADAETSGVDGSINPETGEITVLVPKGTGVQPEDIAQHYTTAEKAEEIFNPEE